MGNDRLRCAGTAWRRSAARCFRWAFALGSLASVRSASWGAVYESEPDWDSWWAARYRWPFWPSAWGAYWAFNENSTSWGRLRARDKALLVLVVAFSVSQLFIILPLLGSHPSLGTMLLWFSDPLLSLLLIEAILVRRSVIRMGQGLVAKCWGMFVLAIVVTSAGDAAIWASSHNLLSESITALSWYIWFVAAAAFASAPAYQLAAISLTREGSMHLAQKR